MKIDREPDRHLGKGTPCWDLPDGRTVVSQGRQQIIIMPAQYVPVPPEEVEHWEKELVDCLVDLLKGALERRTAEAAGVSDLYNRWPRKRRSRPSGRRESSTSDPRRRGG